MGQGRCGRGSAQPCVDSIIHMPEEKLPASHEASTAALARRAALRIEKLRNAALKLEARHEETLAATAPALNRSARNLVHYLAVRTYDIRGLQADLARLGLSSLGRMEAHAMASLDMVRRLLLLIRGHAAPTEPDPPPPVSIDGGRAMLARHAAAILGPVGSEHKTRIMVTMPADAADDPTLIRDLLARGMQIMRINCAHDSREVWARMLQHLRQAEKRLGRRCKVSFDLAGPKLRTGPIEPGTGIVKWRPQRDALGRVVAPAVVRLTTGAIEPIPGQCSIPVAGALIAKARAGDTVALADARGKHRELKIVAVSAGACTCHADATAYAISGTELTLRRGKRVLVAVKVGELAPRPQKILLRPGDQLEVFSGDGPGRPALLGADGRLLEPAAIGCALPEVFSRVTAGERIFFDDGLIGGVIRHAGRRRMRVEIVSALGGAARLDAEKGINLPDTDLRLPALTAKDRDDLDFVVRHADMVAMSFVQRAADVEDLIAELALRSASHIGIVLKIETKRGFSHLPSLLLAAMRHPLVAVMVARGDLGVEVGFERLSEVQEEILWLCEAAHIPVIWATQVLESLAQGGVYSRAEVTDAAMAGRAECVMLNKGPFIRETLSFLGGVLHRMQAHQTKKTATFRRLKVSTLER
jgi:pyruvate kinase